MRIHFYLLFFFVFRFTACSKNQSCAVVTLDIQPSAIRCLLYPDTQICTHGLQGHRCWVLLKEPATYIYRRQGKSGLRLWRKDLICGGLCTILVNGGVRNSSLDIKQYGCLLDTCFGGVTARRMGKMSPNTVLKMHEIIVLPSSVEAGITEEV